MPYNGDGVFNPLITFQDDTLATAEDQNSQDGDFAAGLTNCMTRDGQAAALANLSMGSHRLMQLANGVNPTDAVNLQQLTSFFATGTTLVNIAALKAFSNSLALFVGGVINVQGYNTSNDGGGGSYILTTTNPGPDNGGTIIWSSTAGYYWTRLFAASEPLSLLIFGADPSGVANSSTQITNWLTVGIATRRPFYIPGGGQFTDNPRVIDLGPVAGTGIKMYGDAADASAFNITGGGWTLICSTGGGGCFYSKFSGFDISSNGWGGPALQVMRDNYSDAANGFVFEDMRITNSANSGATNSALKLNGVFSCDFRNVTANCGSTSFASATGVASLRMTQASFNRFQGSFSGAGIGIHLTANSGVGASGFSFGNVFHAIDAEVNWYDVQIDTGNAANNTFTGGQWEWTTGGAPFNCTAGFSNVFQNGNIASTLVFGSGGTGWVGVIIENKRVEPTTPGFPATNTPITNNSGMNLNLLITGGIITSYTLTTPTGGVLIFNSGAASTGFLYIPLDAGWTISFSYNSGSGQPGWDWLQR